MAYVACRGISSKLLRLGLPLNRQNGSLHLQTLQGCIRESGSRGMASGARKMFITPSRFNWTRFKNDFHFYVMLGVVPLGAIVFYANIFIGQAELVDIPEGYEPKVWEYHKHPVHRWLARYVFEDPVKQYEMEACKQVHKFEALKQRARNERVKDVMAENDDFRAWYFVPAVDPIASERNAEATRQLKEEEVGTR